MIHKIIRYYSKYVLSEFFYILKVGLFKKDLFLSPLEFFLAKIKHGIILFIFFVNIHKILSKSIINFFRNFIYR